MQISLFCWLEGLPPFIVLYCKQVIIEAGFDQTIDSQPAEADSSPQPSPVPAQAVT